jgi:hypothetical protein
VSLCPLWVSSSRSSTTGAQRPLCQLSCQRLPPRCSRLRLPPQGGSGYPPLAGVCRRLSAPSNATWYEYTVKVGCYVRPTWTPDGSTRLRCLGTPCGLTLLTHAFDDDLIGDYFLEILRRLRENKRIGGEILLEKLRTLPTTGVNVC